ncbi:hypothetical protein ACVW0K_004099 [Streptomyces filamentosus]
MGAGAYRTRPRPHASHCGRDRTRTCGCTRARTCVRACTRARSCVRVCTRARTCVRARTRTRTRARARPSPCTRTCPRRRARTRTPSRTAARRARGRSCTPSGPGLVPPGSPRGISGLPGWPRAGPGAGGPEGHGTASTVRQGTRFTPEWPRPRPWRATLRRNAVARGGACDGRTRPEPARIRLRRPVKVWLWQRLVRRRLVRRGGRSGGRPVSRRRPAVRCRSGRQRAPALCGAGACPPLFRPGAPSSQGRSPRTVFPERSASR